MANTITKTTLEDGVRNLVVLVTIVGDGSGEETNTVLIDRSDYAPTSGTKLVVEKLDGLLTAFSARLIFDATTDLVFAHLPADDMFAYDWTNIGGIGSPKAGAGYNGDILVTTSSLGSGDRGTFTLHMRKA
jgi:hypothetical protein